MEKEESDESATDRESLTRSKDRSSILFETFSIPRREKERERGRNEFKFLEGKEKSIRRSKGKFLVRTIPCSREDEANTPNPYPTYGENLTHEYVSATYVSIPFVFSRFGGERGRVLEYYIRRIPWKVNTKTVVNGVTLDAR